MPNAPTPILNLTVPTPGGDSGAWGPEVNVNWAILDSLGAAPIINIAGPFNAVPSVFPRQVIRVTTGAVNVSIVLPDPASCPGKSFTVKKVDAGIGQVVVTPVAGNIEGQPQWNIGNQFQYVEFFSNGATFDIIANN
jgi:hypothetical protein